MSRNLYRADESSSLILHTFKGNNDANCHLDHHHFAHCRAYQISPERHREKVAGMRHPCEHGGFFQIFHDFSFDIYQ
jgi:hypothetical protein